MKLVINTDFGGFGLSEKAKELYEELSGEKFNYWTVSRADSILVKVVEELGEAANGDFSELEVVEIPDGAFYYINEYDGLEEVFYSMTKLFRVWSNEK